MTYLLYTSSYLYNNSAHWANQKLTSPGCHGLPVQSPSTEILHPPQTPDEPAHVHDVAPLRDAPAEDDGPGGGEEDAGRVGEVGKGKAGSVLPAVSGEIKILARFHLPIIWVV